MRIYSVIFSAVLFIPALVVDKVWGFFPVYFPLYAVSWVCASWLVVKKAWRNLKKRVIFDENFLMLVASVGAFVLSLTYGGAELFSPSGGEVMMDGVAVMLLYQVGEELQSRAVKKSRKGIKAIMAMRPDKAIVERDGVEVQVWSDEVEIGETVVVKPGERIPIDGIVSSGEGYLDTSSITGESEPLFVTVNSEVKSGCIVTSDLIRIVTTKPFEQSTVSKMLELVEEAENHKAKEETFISAFAKVYTPIVCALALLIAVVPSAIFAFLGLNEWARWIYTALSLLVVSCPCALVISVPLTFFGGIGGGTKAGALVKGANVFSPLVRANVVAFDKTGTVTRGEFVVTECTLSNADLALVASAESKFTHPIAKSIVKFFGENLPDCEKAELVAGMGVRAVVSGNTVTVGKHQALPNAPLVNSPFTVIYAQIGERYAGHIVLRDEVKESSKTAIATLKREGIKTIMLTGDKSEVAQAVANEVGVDEFFAELLPADKVEKIKELQKHDNVIFVGDGVNDAPSLATADVGCAMGGLGSDVAIEASDAVIMTDDLTAVCKLKKHAKKVIRIARENVFGSLAVKIGVMLIAVLWADFPLWLAIIGDVGICIVAVFNAMRALNVK